MKNLHFDGYKNVLTQYNAQKDSDNAWGFSSAWWIPAAIISQHYYSDGLFSKIVDVPAEEATKHGFDLGIDEDEIRDKVFAKLDDLDIEQKLSTGIKWQRLYGGAIGVMITDDADRLDTPLDLNTVKNMTEIRIVESPLIVPDWMSLYRGGYGKIGVPEYFIVNSTSGTFTAHSSRCLMFRNGIMPEHSMPDAMRFWGVPEYMRIKDIVRNTAISHEYAVKMLERSVQGVYKMKDLAALVATQDGEGQILERLNLLDMARGLINSIAIDADNESYDFVTFQLSGIKEAVDTQCNMLSAVTNIPQTLLFGRSPDGMNATGESDFESYYSGIERLQRLYLKPNINKLMDVVLACLKNSGEIDEIPDISISFNPLKVIDEDQQTALNQAKADYLKGNLETAMQLVDAQIINPEEIRASIVKNKTFTLENLFAEIAEKEENGNNENNPDITEDTPIDIDFSGILENDNKTDIKEDTPIEITLTDDSEALQEDSEQSITKDTPIEVELPKYTSAAIIVMNDKGQVLVGDRADGNGLCGAGGHIEEGESPIVAAIRECSEEFGITPEHIVPIGAIDNLPEQFGKPFVYMGFHYGSIKEVQPEEIKNPRFLDISEICNGEHKVFEPFNRSLDMFKSVLGVEDKSESQEDAITTDSEIKIDLTKEKPEIKHKSNTDGGEGSGNYGHKGRRGSVGGSAKSSASTSKGAERRQKKKTVTTNKTKSEKSGKSVDITEKNDIIKKQEEIRRKLVDNIVNDVFPSKFTGDQEKHLYNERYRCPTKSYFLKNFEDVFAYQDEQLKEYLLRVANIGKMAYKGNNIRAIVKYDEIIGVYREGDTRKEIETKFVLFIFSKDGVHCMPMYEHNNKG